MSLLLLKLPRGFPFTQNKISHFTVTLPCVICIAQPEPVLELIYHFPYQILAGHFSLWFLSGLCDSSQILHLGALLRMCRGSYWGCAVPNRCLAMAPCTNLLKVTIFPLLLSVLGCATCPHKGKLLLSLTWFSFLQSNFCLLGPQYLPSPHLKMYYSHCAFRQWVVTIEPHNNYKKVK